MKHFIYFVIFKIFLRLTLVKSQQVTPFGNAQFVPNRFSIWSPEEIIRSTYNNQEAPIINDTAIKILIHLHLLSFQTFNNGKTQKFDLVLIQSWSDYRLQLPRSLPFTKKIVLDRRWKDVLWTPLIYLKSLIKDQQNFFLEPTIHLTLTNRTQVQLIAYFSLEINCNYKKTDYPMSQQECNLEIITVSQTWKTVELVWQKFDLNDKLLHLSMPHFRVTAIENQSCIFENKFGNFSCLKASIFLEPNVSHCLLPVYFPSFCLVLFCFAGFWTPKTAYCVRISMVFIPLLILINEKNTLEKKVCNTYPINVWFVLCTTFICSSLFQYVITLNDEWSSKYENWNLEPFFNKFVPIGAKMFKSNQNNDVIDMISRIAFPFFFIFSIFIYFLYFAF